ncbi:MAG: DNA polymerase III subunit delta' [Panacagrimonas sp.]
MALSEMLPWHAETWARTQLAIRAGRLGHALLLAGPQGVGKRHFARSLATGLLCEDRHDDGTGCGRCRSCTQLAAGSHPNLIWLSREINEKTEREKRDISMEQLRAAMERLALSSHYGQSRVVVIDPADALNISGINAVLKTVEEPPAGCFILLISERPMALAPTLRSRCQRVSFPLPSTDVALRWLRQLAPDVDAHAALRQSGGAPVSALEAVESGDICQRDTWRAALLELAERRTDPLSVAARVPKDDAERWIRTYLALLHDVLRALAGAADRDPRIDRIAPRLGAGQIEPLVAEAIESQVRLRANANAQLLIESLMISWWHRAGQPESNSTPRAA